jgi:hypothetical protein
MGNEFALEVTGNKSSGYKGSLTTPDAKVFTFEAKNAKDAQKQAKSLAEQWVEANRKQHVETYDTTFEL